MLMRDHSSGFKFDYVISISLIMSYDVIFKVFFLAIAFIAYIYAGI